jgi:hypothetical protein
VAFIVDAMDTPQCQSPTHIAFPHCIYCKSLVPGISFFLPHCAVLLLSLPRALPESLLMPPPYADLGAAPRPTTTRRWRGSALLCHRMQEEGAHQIQNPSDQWQHVGGERRGGAIVHWRRVLVLIKCRFHVPTCRVNV